MRTLALALAVVLAVLIPANGQISDLQVVGGNTTTPAGYFVFNGTQVSFGWSGSCQGLVGVSGLGPVNVAWIASPDPTAVAKNLAPLNMFGVQSPAQAQAGAKSLIVNLTAPSEGVYALFAICVGFDGKEGDPVFSKLPLIVYNSATSSAIFGLSPFPDFSAIAKNQLDKVLKPHSSRGNVSYVAVTAPGNAPKVDVVFVDPVCLAAQIVAPNLVVPLATAVSQVTLNRVIHAWDLPFPADFKPCCNFGGILALPYTSNARESPNNAVLFKQGLAAFTSDLAVVDDKSRGTGVTISSMNATRWACGVLPMMKIVEGFPQMAPYAGAMDQWKTGASVTVTGTVESGLTGAVGGLLVLESSISAADQQAFLSTGKVPVSDLKAVVPGFVQSTGTISGTSFSLKYEVPDVAPGRYVFIVFAASDATGKNDWRYVNITRGSNRPLVAVQGSLIAKMAIAPPKPADENDLYSSGTFAKLCNPVAALFKNGTGKGFGTYTCEARPTWSPVSQGISGRLEGAARRRTSRRAARQTNPAWTILMVINSGSTDNAAAKALGDALTAAIKSGNTAFASAGIAGIAIAYSDGATGLTTNPAVTGVTIPSDFTNGLGATTVKSAALGAASPFGLLSTLLAAVIAALLVL
eukprot:tig00001415_g8674.t1